MTIRTRVTELLGIDYPIMMGGMQNVATAELCAAVSAAGGLGTISASLYQSPDELRAALRRVRELTDKPYAVNISISPRSEIDEETTRSVHLAGEAGAAAIETSGKDPSILVPIIHSYGMKHIHKVASTKHVLKANAVGADIVSIVGCEAGGRLGPDMVPTHILVNKAARLCDVPLLYGGGIANGRGLVAALAAGADGVVVGTRFVACAESPISENHKAWIVGHSERDTTICQKAINSPIRCARNRDAERCLALEAQPGCTIDTLMPIISGSVSRGAYANGEVDNGIFVVGQSIGLIDEVLTAKEVIDTMVCEARETVRRLAGYMGL